MTQKHQCVRNHVFMLIRHVNTTETKKKQKHIIEVLMHSESRRSIDGSAQREEDSLAIFCRSFASGYSHNRHGIE